MRPRVFLVQLIILLPLLVLACALPGTAPLPAAAVAPPDPDADPAADPGLEVITIPISVYILDGEDAQLSSGRTAEQLSEVYRQVNAIWAQAGIAFEVRTISRVIVPSPYLLAVADGEFRPFISAAGAEFSLPDPAPINAFYARNIGGPNGVNPYATRLFFVTDSPSVHHERVTAHEIGHILGLHHTLADADRLLYPGTNGMALAEDEIAVARYVARGLLDGLR